MKKVLDYLLSTIYILYFGLMLVIFHPIQMIAFHLFGAKTHQRSVQMLNFFLLHGLYLTGASLQCQFKGNIPQNRPLILVANHQSMFDIIGIIWYLRNYFPIFVSKIELSKGIPSISYNLRKSGAALINRKDGKQATMEIARLGKMIEETNFAATIFPEGTRSRTGALKEFAVGGVAVLMKKAPNALIVPIAVNGSARLNPKGFYPFRSFTKVSWTILPPIERSNLTAEEIVEMCKQQIGEALIVQS